MSPLMTSKSASFQFGSNKPVRRNFLLSKYFIFFQSAIWFVTLRSRVEGYTRFDGC
jgi:hypothetical protein